MTLAVVVAADPSLPAAEIESAFDTVITTRAALRSLAGAVDDDPQLLHTGAPPIVGSLVTELVTRGSTTFTIPACAGCRRTGRKLIRTDEGGMCDRCRRRQTATACVDCHVVKPVAARDHHGHPRCARCAPRPERNCGICARTARIARRARDGAPDVCDNCFRLPTATCSRCRRRRPCSFAATPEPVCTACAPDAPTSAPTATTTGRLRPTGPRDPCAPPATTPHCAAAGPATAATPPAA